MTPSSVPPAVPPTGEGAPSQWWHGYFAEEGYQIITAVTKPTSVPPWEADRTVTVSGVVCHYRMSWDHKPTEAEKAALSG